ncbi:MAG: hypothetical protein KKA73_25285 [Chloroflexi bacterium]|nr:hypothetical protein [Chloroflexota bacterium]MBU1751011.1 hypothetical protein [Chloroflexota bacterium]
MTSHKDLEIVNHRDYTRPPGAGRGRQTLVGRYWHAFKNIAIVFSFAVNFILVLVLLVVLVALLPAKEVFVSPIMGKVWTQLQAFDDAKIETAVQINHQLPIAFPVQVHENPTTVRLTAPVSMNMPARFVLPAGGGTINGTVNIVMPAGTRLPVVIEDMTISVQQTIPVVFDQPVTIYLHDTELHDVIVNFQDILRPFYELLK